MRAAKGGDKMNSENSKLVQSLPDTINVNHEYLALEIQKGVITHIRCGEWGHTGWCWQIFGDACNGQFMTFISRVLYTRKDVRDKFIHSLQDQGLTFKRVMALCIKDMASHSKGGGLYALTGDNGRWYFGESVYEGVIYEFVESYYVDETQQLTAKEFEIVWENVWMEIPTASYDEFMASDDTSNLEGMLTDALTTAKDFDELILLLRGVTQQADEYYQLYSDKNFSIGMSNCITLLKQGQYTKDQKRQVAISNTDCKTNHVSF